MHNIPNLRKLRNKIDSLKKFPGMFNMHVYVGTYASGASPSFKGTDKTISMLREGDCKSCACLAGWTVATILPPDETIDYDSIKDKAGWLLGLDDDEAFRLFLPSCVIIEDEIFNPFGVTPKQALKVIDHLIDTGEINWRVAFK